MPKKQTMSCIKILITSALLAVLLSFNSFCMSAPLRIKHFPFVNAQEKYMQGLLNLALSYSKEPAIYKENTNYSYTQLPQNALIEHINKGTVSVMWSGTSVTLEQQLQPIRIPLYKGLLGHRLLLIKQDKLNDFTKISDIETLKTIRLGQGRDWPDTFILRSTGLNLVTSNSYPALFEMLNDDQFDAFPRGLQEPWAEMKARPTLNLSVEPNLLLAYKLPAYFFVRRDNSTLANAIEKGLEAAIADKNFDDYFRYSKQVSEAIERAQAIGRAIIKIDNPNLPKQTPVNRPELWVDIAEI